MDGFNLRFSFISDRFTVIFWRWIWLICCFFSWDHRVVVIVCRFGIWWICLWVSWGRFIIISMIGWVSFGVGTWGRVWRRLRSCGSIEINWQGSFCWIPCWSRTWRCQLVWAIPLLHQAQCLVSCMLICMFWWGSWTLPVWVHSSWISHYLMFCQTSPANIPLIAGRWIWRRRFQLQVGSSGSFSCLRGIWLRRGGGRWCAGVTRWRRCRSWVVGWVLWGRSLFRIMSLSSYN